MPELPEVETVKNVLKSKLINRKIVDIEVRYPEMIKTNINDFYKLINQVFLDIKRLGKWLIFETNDYYLVSHLRMEGKYYYVNNLTYNKHDHVIFKLDNDYYLRYNDTRKFGVMYLVLKDNLMDTPIKDLGLEPDSNELNIEYLNSKYKIKRMPIKTVLLDQSIITGIGNIYADEILFKSRINPKRKCNTLNDLELQSIIDNTRIIFNDAIKMGGTTIRSYTSSLGVFGSYQDKLMVHTISNCSICNSKTKIIKINGRSTYYCPICQGDNYE